MQRIEAWTFIIQNWTKSSTLNNERGSNNAITEAYWARAKEYNIIGEYGKAIADMTMKISRSQRGLGKLDDLDFAFRAALHFQVGSYEEALSDIDQWDRLYKQYADTNYRGLLLRGDIAMATGKYAQAVGFYESYIKEYPNEPGLADKLANAKRLVQQPNPPPPPAPPPDTSVPCKMFPNLC